MKVSKINYERLVNTGNYSHEKYGIEIVLAEGEKAQDAIDNAKKIVSRQLESPTEREREIAHKVNAFDEEIPF